MFKVRDKFNIGDNVKRIGSSRSESKEVEALGMIGEIKFISPEGEWPPNSGTIIPKMYAIHFPNLYKGTVHEGTLLGVVDEDLELVVDIIPTSVKIGLGSVRPSVLGVGASCVSQLKKTNLEDYIDANGYKIPTVVTIVEIISETKVKVKDIFNKTYEKNINKLEPVLYDINGFEFYATMQNTAKSLNNQLGGGNVNKNNNIYYQKYMRYKFKYNQIKN